MSGEEQNKRWPRPALRRGNQHLAGAAVINLPGRGIAALCDITKDQFPRPSVFANTFRQNKAIERREGWIFPHFWASSLSAHGHILHII